MADFGLHWVQTIKASRHDYVDAPLQLELETGYCPGELIGLPHRLTLFLANDALTTDLVEAINSVVAKHQRAQAPLAEAAE